MQNIQRLREAITNAGCADETILALIQAIEEQLALYQRIETCLYDSDLYLVYRHTCPKGKVYIGITKNLPQTRWNEGSGYESQKRFYKAIQKYGWINFKHEILAAGLTEAEARQLEKELVLSHQSWDEQYGYNTQLGPNAEQETGVDAEIESPSHQSVSKGKARVIDWVKMHPEGSRQECAQSLGLGLPTVYAYWPKKDRKPSARELIADWLKEHPDGQKIECMNDLDFSYGTVSNYWPKKPKPKQVISEWIANNPEGTPSECEEQTGLSYEIISAHWPGGIPTSKEEEVKETSLESFLSTVNAESLTTGTVAGWYDKYCDYCSTHHSTPESKVAFSKVVLKKFNLTSKIKKINFKVCRCYAPK